MNGSQQKYHSVLVIDDHNMLVNGIKLVIGDQFREFYHANSGSAGIALALKYQPQLIVLDNVLPDVSGDVVAREIKYRCPGSRILGYSFNTEAPYVMRMFEAGIHGYVVKREDDSEFIRAVELLLEGRDYYCKEVRNHIVNRIFDDEEQAKVIINNTEFSAKEIEIIKLICKQKTAREISVEVFLSERTVEQYRSNISRRIGAKNIGGIIKFALKYGIITLEDL